MTERLLTDWCIATEASVRGNTAQRNLDAGDWIPAAVPSTVQKALMDAGRAPDPFLDRQSEWFTENENDTWWYKTEFSLSEEERAVDRLEVVFEGIAVLATVWLNGTIAGTTWNALHEHRFDVTSLVNRDGPNVMAVECRSGIIETAKRVRLDISPKADDVRPYLRAPGMMYGWDFAPRLPLTGIWRPVKLVAHRVATISDLFVRTVQIEGENAEIEIEFAVDYSGASQKDVEIGIEIHEDLDRAPVWSYRSTIRGAGVHKVRTTVKNAHLWWPAPVGEPFRYTLSAVLSCADQKLHAVSQRFGIRTVELAQDDQFTFRINGRDVFAKGANWVPADTLTLDAPEERCRHLLLLAQDAHYNMLRVWGGGIYESELFYDLCDEYGIMVWQDFMYACSMYPDDDPAFVESATREAQTVVTRLRKHPSVVVWCGNNECQEAWVLGDWPERAHRHFGERFYDHILPDTVARLSPETPYWPGSPYGGPTTRSRTEGDFHDWYSLPSWKTYDENAPRFSSEYGFRSVSERATLDAGISQEFQWEPRHPLHVVWKHHHGWCGWMREVMPDFGSAETLDEYIMLSQEAQATLMRYAIEVYRRRMYSTSGSLIWMFDEPWPGVTFSVVDYFGRQKAAYHWVRNAYRPLMVMVYEKDHSVWAANDLDKSADYTLRIRRFSHSGALFGEARETGTLSGNRATRLMDTLTDEVQIADPAREFLHVELESGDHTSERTYHAALRRDWVLDAATISVTAERIDSERVRVHLLSDTFAHFVSVGVDDSMATYSDNFVGLIPGETREIVVTTREDGPVRVRTGNSAGQVVAEVFVADAA